jgi:hypothetical protein
LQNALHVEEFLKFDSEDVGMARILLLSLAFVTLVAAPGCRLCDPDRPRLFHRLFDRDDDKPSKKGCETASDQKPCNNLLGAPTMPVGYGQPMYGAPVYGTQPSYPNISFPSTNITTPSRQDELPFPGRIPSTNVPTDATPTPANPSMTFIPGTNIRVTADPKK